MQGNMISPDHSHDLSRHFSCGNQACCLNRSSCAQARKLVIFIEGNHGAETTRIEWLGLKGQRTYIKHGIVEGAEYELIPDASRYGVGGLMGDRRMAH